MITNNTTGTQQENDPAGLGAETPARTAWIAGMRSLLDALEADPEIRLPRAAQEPVKFYVAGHEDAERIAGLLDDVQRHDRPERIFRYETTGRIGAVEVAVYTGEMSGVSL
ncbi:hypothetical protein AB0B28_08320 [Glycomyces sp. NPDC046736]|uniref:hypothetical protein n=1 Tax=Glycomyces sp. NPDC046736 TaxID=3155615 RepID=UPI0034001D7B